MSGAAEQRVKYRTLKVGWDDPEERLNALAAEGWQVVERIDVEGGITHRLVLERPVPEAATDGGEDGAE